MAKKMITTSDAIYTIEQSRILITHGLAYRLSAVVVVPCAQIILPKIQF
jgi:hypothetical protein